MCRFLMLFMLFLTSLFSNSLLWSQVQVFHTKPYDMLYFTSFSPDGKHMAQSGSWYVRIYDMQGKMVGEWFDRKPRISFRKDFRFWEIHRQGGSLIAFINNEELAITEKNITGLQTVNVVGLNGSFKREIKVPMKQLPDEAYSTIDQIIVSPLMDRLITVESWTGDFVIRDMNFKEIRRVNLSGTNDYSDRYVQIEEIKFLLDGSGFIIKSKGQPLPEGWIGFLTLYDKDGNLVRDLMSDRWIKTIETPYGPVARENDSRPPEEWDISPDGKSVVFISRVGKIDKKLLGSNKYKEINPPGGLAERPYDIAHGIRTIDIHSGKQNEAYVLQGGFVVVNNKRETNHLTHPHINQIFFAPNNKDFIGVSNDYGLYKISSDGKVIDFLPYPNDDEFFVYNKEEDAFSIHYKKKHGKEFDYFSIKPQDLYLTPDRKTFVSKSLNTSLYFLNTDGKVLGQIKSYYTPYKYAGEESPIRVSHTGRYLVMEIDFGKKSVLWDFKTNTITKEDASIYWDSTDSEFRMKLDHKDIRIKYTDAEAVLPANLQSSVVPFANKQIAVSDNGLIIIDKEGTPIKKHPKSTYFFRYAMHPTMEYYMVPNVDAKVKTIVKVSITGQKISEYWIGSFISKVLFSPDGSLLIGSLDNSGCISIWDSNNKLVDFPGQTKGHFNEGRFFDLHPAPITKIAITKNNRFLFTGTSDRLIVTDLKTGERATLSLFYRTSRSSKVDEIPIDFIASDSKGRFECSPEARERVSIVENGQNRTDSLWKKYYTEKLVWNFLQGK